MPSRLAVAIVLFSLAVVSATDTPTRDITPDMGSSAFTFSEAFALDEGGLLVLAGRAGFRRSPNGGRHWERAMSGYVDANGVEPYGNGFCQAPSAPSTVYSPTGLGTNGVPIFRTDNLGRTWRSVGATPGEGAIDCAVHAFDPDVLYVLSFDPESETGAGLFKSTDGGRSFVRGGAGMEELFISRVRTSPTRPDTLYVDGTRSECCGDDPDNPVFTSTSSVYISTDGGVSFAPLVSFPSPFYVDRLYTHPTRDGMLFLTLLEYRVDGEGQSRLLRSTDGGATFAPVGPAGFVAFDRRDPAAVYLATGPDGLYRSTDFGATFARLPRLTADQTGPYGILTVAATTSRGGKAQVYIATQRGLYRSDDGGGTFASIRDTYRGAGVNDLAIDASGRLMVGAVLTVPVFRAQQPGHPRSYDVFGAGLGAIRDLDAGAVAPSRVDVNTAVVATRGVGVFVTSDGGLTWAEAINSSPRAFPSTDHVRALFAPGSATRVYVFGETGLFRSDDAGLSFRAVGCTSAFRSCVRGLLRAAALAADPSNPDVIYLGGMRDLSEGLFKSVDGGETIVELAVRGRFSMLAIDPYDAQTVYAGNRAGGVLRSTDGGASWQDTSRGLPPGVTLAVAADPRIERRIYAWVQAGGLFVSADGGESWRAADTGESVRRSGIGRAAIAVDPITPGRVYLGNSGILQVDTLPEADR